MSGKLESINPATGELLQSYEMDSSAALEAKLQRAWEDFLQWRNTSFSERAAHMRSAAALLEQEKRELARLMTLEMGKPLRAAVQEAEKCALACRFYAEHAERLLADEHLPVTGPAPGAAPAGQTISDERLTTKFVQHQPLGPVLAIMPWNFPFWQVFRFAAPAVMAGNVGLLKHAPNVPQCALAIGDIFRRAGFPEGVFQALLMDIEPVAGLIEDRRVAAVTLTGSVRAGRSVAALAGRAIKKTVLELGGSDAFIVMPSADLERTVAAAVQARTLNNGQSCIAAKRFLVHEDIYDAFEQQLVGRMAALRVGDPLEESTDIGPLARPDLLALLEDQVERTVQMGARLLLGGRRLDRRGNFYSPTVLAGIPERSPAYGEELFGPVASLWRVHDLEQAIALANASRFGLGASCWTNDPGECEVFVGRIEAGSAFVNEIVASDVRLPFGGMKQSGYGRELGLHGIREFVNVKTVVLSTQYSVKQC
jgi:succinate-semialdehyde dehydrogenase/glutarate-semialdehyde dehydrogenase